MRAIYRLGSHVLYILGSHVLSIWAIMCYTCWVVICYTYWAVMCYTCWVVMCYTYWDNMCYTDWAVMCYTYWAVMCCTDWAVICDTYWVVMCYTDWAGICDTYWAVMCYTDWAWGRAGGLIDVIYNFARSNAVYYSHWACEPLKSRLFAYHACSYCVMIDLFPAKSLSIISAARKCVSAGTRVSLPKASLQCAPHFAPLAFSKRLSYIPPL